MRKNQKFILFITSFAFIGAFFVLISVLSSPSPADDTQLPTLAILPSGSPTSQNTDGNLSSASVSNDAVLSTSTPTNLSLITNVPDEPVPNQVIITFDPDASAEERAAYIQSIGGTISKNMPMLDTVVVSVPIGTDVNTLPTSPVVLTSEADYYVVAQQEAVNDPRYAEQWALPMINAPSAWAELPNTPVIVAVIDSGLCAEHADLQGRILAGYDFVEGDDVPQDAFGHGCGVAGIIAANTNNEIGIAGIAPNAQIMPLRVLNAQGIGTYSDVASAILYAADHDAQIINLSLGGTQSSDLLENAVNYAVSHGVLIVAAAGNTSNRVLYPAAYEPVIAVGSIDRSMQTSSFSPTSQIDLYAPGRDILTTQTDGSYALMTGTSFAAPQVAGIAALEIAYGRSLTLDGGVFAFGNASSPVIVMPTATPMPLSSQYAALLSAVRARGIIRVIISLSVNFQPEGLLSPQGVQAQQAVIAQAQQNVMTALSGFNAVLLSQSDQWVVPGIAYQVDESALLQLMSLPEVVNIVEDISLEQALDTSAGVVDAPEAWTLGYTGAGQTVVIIDSGIESTHSNFGGRVVAEACYSWNQPDTDPTATNNSNDSLCANGSIQQTGAGAANLSRCTLFNVNCSHGTHTAGIAAGEDSTYRGIAPDANIIAIQVFTRWIDCPTIPGTDQQCILSYTSDQISALNYTYTTLRPLYNIAAINISIGSGIYASACDNQNMAMTDVINQLYAANIATVVASSNNGSINAISFPACVSNAISVGSTNDSDVVSSFSNAAQILDLLAPGESITASIPGNTFGVKTGTSMAAPHVTGAWALLRQAVPTLTVAQALNAFRNTGVPVFDARNGLTFRRIDIDDAILWFFTMTITDQALLNAMQAQLGTPLRPILVVITPSQMNIYLDLDGVTGLASVQVEPGYRTFAMYINSVTDIEGNEASQTLVDAVNIHLPGMLVGALNQLLASRVGAAHDAAGMTLYNNYLNVSVIP